jgi:protein-tyrosine phosphatase
VSTGTASVPGTDELLARRVVVPGTFNFRDVGGYPASDGRSVTKWGTLFRADALHALDDAGRSALAELGVRTVIDLRSETEREESPDQVEGVVETALHLPVFDPERLDAKAPNISLEAVYEMMIAERGPQLVGAIKALAQPGALPAIVHCAGGKDRTGVVIALVLAGVGVADEVVVADFAATSLFITEAFLKALNTRREVSEADADARASMLASDPDLMVRILGLIRDEHGSVEAFLRKHGLEEHELDTLSRELLTETNSGI